VSPLSEVKEETWHRKFGESQKIAK